MTMIRGVNLGGWLVLERWITPSFFVLDCPYCPTALPYPVDQWTLLSRFGGGADASEKKLAYMKTHWDTWVTERDIAAISAAGLTHVRLPVPHWMLGDIKSGEPWVQGEWPYVLQLAGWCRRHGLQVWLDLHTAPGSQNGFDNSGQLLPRPTGVGWSGVPSNVERTVKAVRDLATAVKESGIDDVATGFGILNEPFKGENYQVVRKFYEAGYEAVREILGPGVSVYVHDMFDASSFDDGFWHEQKYNNTFLDSHIYHVFNTHTRAFSPRQHVAYACRHSEAEVLACCGRAADAGGAGGGGRKLEHEEEKDQQRLTTTRGEERSKNSSSSNSNNKGIGRVVAEWSAGVDTLIDKKLDDLLAGYSRLGVFPEVDRQLPSKRKVFLRNFVEAQMVAYETAAERGQGSTGWFFWNFKTEGGAFAEWSYLRGVAEGWIPVVDKNKRAIDQFGSCYDILRRTDDGTSVIHEFPEPGTMPQDWQDVAPDDDVVMSHGASLLNGGGAEQDDVGSTVGGLGAFAERFGATAFCTVALMALYLWLQKVRKRGYTVLHESNKV